MQSWSINTQLGNSILVDGGPLTSSQSDAVVGVASAYVYDPAGARLLLENINATTGWSTSATAALLPALPGSTVNVPGAQAVSGDPETVLSIRATFLDARFSRPAGLGCASNATAAATAAGAMVCQRDPGALIDALAALSANFGSASASLWSAAAAGASATPNPTLLPCNSTRVFTFDAANGVVGALIGLPAGTSGGPQAATITSCGGNGMLSGITLAAYDAFPARVLVGGALPSSGDALSLSSGLFENTTGTFNTTCSSVQVTLYPPPAPAAAASAWSSSPSTFLSSVTSPYVAYIAAYAGSGRSGSISLTSTCAPGATIAALTTSAYFAFGGGGASLSDT